MNASIVLIILFFIFLSIFKKNIINFISPLFVFSAAMYFLHINQYLMFDGLYQYEGWVDQSEVNRGLFLFLLLGCLLCFIVGYSLVSRPNKSVWNEDKVNWSALEIFAVFSGFFGLTLYMSFVSRTGFAVYYSNHFAKTDFSVGAQIYYMRYFVFTAFAILINIRLYSKLSIYGKFTLIFFTCYLIFEAIAREERGSWIRIFSILFISYVLYQYKSGRLSDINVISLMSKYFKLLCLAVVGFFITLSMVILRLAKGDFSEFFRIIINEPELILAGSGHDVGNEYVTAYNAFISFNYDPLPDFGLKWIIPFINFIPRTMWESKPVWNDFSTSIFEYIDRYSPIISGTGSAETGFIDAYYRFFFLSPIFFIILGAVSKKFFLNAIYGSVKHILAYICFYIGLIYFLTQNMFPFVVFGLFMYIPVFAYFLLSRLKVK